MVKHRGDNICGVLLLDKPSGRSSNFYLQRVKYLLNAKKAGHTGSLDPLATGLLPICFGKATCLSEYFLHSEKSYEAIIQLGVITDSHDCDGEVVEYREVDVSEERLEKALEKFRGEIEQVPPMVSALKHKGQPLYKLALQGKEIERKARKMTVHTLEGQLIDNHQAKLKIHCSSGFYVRQLAADIGEILGCGAHIIALRRSTSKHLSVTQAIGFEQLQEDFLTINSNEDKQAYLQDKLLAADELLKSLPALFVDKANAEHVSHGRKIPITVACSESGDEAFGKNDEIIQDITTQHFRLYQSLSAGNHFLGIAEITSEKMIKVRRLFNECI